MLMQTAVAATLHLDVTYLAHRVYLMKYLIHLINVLRINKR